MVLWSGKCHFRVHGVAAALSRFRYRSQYLYPSALLAPAESGTGGLSGLMKQYGGLASLAGVSLPGGEEGSELSLVYSL